MGQLDIAESVARKTRRIKIKIAGKDVDIRLSTVPTSFASAWSCEFSSRLGPSSSLTSSGFRQGPAKASRKMISENMDHSRHRPHGQR